MGIGNRRSNICFFKCFSGLVKLIRYNAYYTQLTLVKLKQAQIVCSKYKYLLYPKPIS